MPISDKISPSEACILLIGNYQHAIAKRAVEASQLKPVGKNGNATLYDSREILRAIGRELHGANARDQRDLAIARKANADAQRIEREWIPIGDATGAVVELASIFLTAVEELDLEADQDTRSEFVRGILESVQDTIDGWARENL